jgi:hypothetical protein
MPIRYHAQRKHIVSSVSLISALTITFLLTRSIKTTPIHSSNPSSTNSTPSPSSSLRPYGPSSAAARSSSSLRARGSSMTGSGRCGFGSCWCGWPTWGVCGRMRASVSRRGEGSCWILWGWVSVLSLPCYVVLGILGLAGERGH